MGSGTIAAGPREPRQHRVRGARAGRSARGPLGLVAGRAARDGARLGAPGRRRPPAPVSGRCRAAPVADPAGINARALSIGIAVGAYAISFGAVSVAAGPGRAADPGAVRADVHRRLAVRVRRRRGRGRRTGGSGRDRVAAGAAQRPLRAAPGHCPQPRWPPDAAAAGLAADGAPPSSRSTSPPRWRWPTRAIPAATRRAFWATGWSVFVLWNLGTLLGALGAASLSDPKVLGLDAAIPAGFLALLWPRLVDRSAWALAVASGVLALALAPVLRPGMPVLAGAGLAVARRPVADAGAILMWPAVLVASLASFVTKWAGHLLPESLVERPLVRRATALLPIGLLAALLADPDVLVADGLRARRPRGRGRGGGRGAAAAGAVPGGGAVGGSNGSPPAGGRPRLTGGRRDRTPCPAPPSLSRFRHHAERRVAAPRGALVARATGGRLSGHPSAGNRTPTWARARSRIRATAREFATGHVGDCSPARTQARKCSTS